MRDETQNITDRYWEYRSPDLDASQRKGIMLSLMEWPNSGDFMPAKFTSLGGVEWYFNGEASNE